MIPAGDIAHHFEQLTTGEGTEILTGPGNSWQRKVERCPLEPWDAIAVLVGLYDLKSADACVAALERERKEIEEQRQALAPYADAPAVAFRLRTLPTLRHLPDRRSTRALRGSARPPRPSILPVTPWVREHVLPHLDPFTARRFWARLTGDGWRACTVGRAA